MTGRFPATGLSFAKPMDCFLVSKWQLAHLSPQNPPSLPIIYHTNNKQHASPWGYHRQGCLGLCSGCGSSLVRSSLRVVFVELAQRFSCHQRSCELSSELENQSSVYRDILTTQSPFLHPQSQLSAVYSQSVELLSSNRHLLKRPNYLFSYPMYVG